MRGLYDVVDVSLDDECVDEDRTVVDVIARIASLHPLRRALMHVETSGVVKEWTYGEIWPMAISWAQAIHRLLPPPSSHTHNCQVVGVFGTSSPLLCVMELSVILAGRVIVPLDLSDPRLGMMLEDVSASLLLVHGGDERHRVEHATHTNVLILDVTLVKPSPPNALVLPPSPVGASLSHICFTSGSSSGRPQGCASSHALLAAYCLSKNRVLEITEDSIVFVASPATFDPSLGDFFATLCIGATLAVTNPSHVFGRLGWALHCTRSSHVITTPSLFSTLETEWDGRYLPFLKCVGLGGEVTPDNVVHRWGSSVRLCNLYGVTECAVYQAWGVMGNGTPPSSISNSLGPFSLFLVTSAGTVVRPGSNEEGEIWITGPHLRPPVCYFNQPQLSASKFVNLPMEMLENGIVAPIRPQQFAYRTGDVARTVAGPIDTLCLQILGRNDSQCKIRGKRVELNEINDVISKLSVDVLSGVECMLIDEQLVAWCVTSSKSDIIPPSRHAAMTRALWTVTSARLPRHMVPARWMFIDEFPLLPTGKIARRLLSQLPLSATPDWHDQQVGLEMEHDDDDVDNVGINPHVLDTSLTAWQTVIASSWSSVLGVRVSSLSANFLELGGDSLSALRACRHIADLVSAQPDVDLELEFEFGKNLEMFAPIELLQRPRLADYWEFLKSELEKTRAPVLDCVPQSTAVKCLEIVLNPISECLLHCAGVGSLGAVRLCCGVGDGDTTNAALVPVWMTTDYCHGNTKMTTPLHAACMNGHEGVVRFLVAQRFGVNAGDSEGRTPLHLASYAGSLECVTILINAINKTKNKQGCSMIWVCDMNGQNALHHAARGGAPGAVIEVLMNTLMSRSKSKLRVLPAVDSVDRWGRTALHWATVNGRRNTLVKLLEYGGNPNICDKSDENCVEIAERRARCGARERGQGVPSSLFGDLAKLLGGSGKTKVVAGYSSK